MAQYTGKQSVLDASLGDFKNIGFSLVEADDHTLELYFKDKLIAVYNSTQVPIETIRQGCQNFVNNVMRNLQNG